MKVKTYFSDILSEFEIELNALSVEIDDILVRSEKSIDLTVETLKTIRKKVCATGFESEADEIYFFKCIKPSIVSQLIYQISIYNIEVNSPNGSIKIKKRYIQTELKKLKNYFDENLDFYRYYRTGCTYLDQTYFVRGRHDIRLRLDSHIYESDPQFCTSHDYKISNIIANDRLQVYLENELTKLDFQNSVKGTELNTKNKLQWTGSKVSLIELLYALHVSGSFNHGNTDIKTIAIYFEKVFGIELGDYYRTYLEIRLRNNSTKFLDVLKESLQKKMEDDDEK